MSILNKNCLQYPYHNTCMMHHKTNWTYYNLHHVLNLIFSHHIFCSLEVQACNCQTDICHVTCRDPNFCTKMQVFYYAQNAGNVTYKHRGGRCLTSVGLAQAPPNKHRGGRRLTSVGGSLRLAPTNKLTGGIVCNAVGLAAADLDKSRPVKCTVNLH